MSAPGEAWTGQSAMMIRKELFWLLAVLTLVVVSPPGGQTAQLAQIGRLGAQPAKSDTGSQLFARELSKLGYVEGKNFVFVYRFADNKLERLPALADEMTRLNFNVIVTLSNRKSVV